MLPARSLLILVLVLSLLVAQPSHLAASGGFLAAEPVPGQDMPTPCGEAFLTP